jgi:hypothetical protein
LCDPQLRCRLKFITIVDSVAGEIKSEAGCNTWALVELSGYPL